MPNFVWTDAQRQFVSDNAHRMKDQEVAAKLTQICGRPVTVNTVRQLRKRLGIKKRQGRGYCEVLGRRANLS